MHSMDARCTHFVDLIKNFRQPLRWLAGEIF
jgi:hypothetical protein